MAIEEETSTKQASARTIVIVSSIALLGIWSVWFGYYYNCFGGMPTTEGSAGTFGDFFGSLNSLLSGGALVGAILAIYLQSKELKETQKQIRLQVIEARETKEEFELQRATSVLYQQIAQYINTETKELRALADILERVAREPQNENRFITRVSIEKKAESTVNALYALTRVFNHLMEGFIHEDLRETDLKKFKAKRKQLFMLYSYNIGTEETEAIYAIQTLLKENPALLELNPSLYWKISHCVKKINQHNRALNVQN